MSDVDPRTQAAIDAVVVARDHSEATLRVMRRRVLAALAAADAYDAANGYARVDLRYIEGWVQGAAARHKPEPGGCTCGFCAWSVEHVAVMSLREALESVAASGVPAHPKEAENDDMA